MSFKNLSRVDRRDRMVAVLRSLVSQSGYSQRVLAEKLDVSKTKVGAILVGQQYMESVELIDWLHVLEITPAAFFKLLDSPVAPE